IHEAGHWIWMKALGLEPKAPMFIPGLGAFVAMKKLPSSEAIHAWVALAGPLIGGLGCAVLYAIGVHTHNDWLAASGNTGFFLNLLQMIPAKPFDGGFAIGSISRWLLVPGTILLFALGLLTGSAILLILAIISLFSWKRPSKSKKDTQVGTIADGNNTATDGTNVDAPSLCAPAATWERFAIGFAYLSLIGALAVGYLISFDHVDTLIKK
ncbi:MAG: hypothetical protein K2Z81_22935, partial [Cyanobacteria bacterium]|nr:hypothetical protein [Cyanobacteriota bacterium]